MSDKVQDRASFPIAWKIFLGAAGVVIVAMGVSMYMSYGSAETAARAAVDQSVAEAARTAGTLLNGQQQTLMRGATTFAESPVFRDLVQHGKPGTLIDQAREAADRAGASWVQITDSDGVRLARSDMPAAPMVSIAKSPLISGALEGQNVTAYGIAQDTVLFQAVAVPIVLPNGKRIAVLMAAKNVADSLAYAVREVTSSEIVFYGLDSLGNAHVAASTLQPGPELSIPVAAHVQAHLPPDANYEQRIVAISGTEYVARDDSLLSASGRRLGGFMALRVRAKQAAGFTELRNELILAAGIGVVLAVLFSILLARGITRPLGALVATAQRAAGGDYSPPPPVKSRDEIGVLAGAFSALLSELRDQQALVQTLKTSGERTQVSREKAEALANAATISTSKSIAQGSLFAGRYLIVSTLGQGGMGVVYKATD